ncbi:MAG: Mitochondrial ATPase complex subunit atp10 [Bogoriella megaspora]|nr:MAG: Mitochondrial ATPase complex subunit atp10 [Bogoriella megaspora]
MAKPIIPQISLHFYKQLQLASQSLCLRCQRRLFSLSTRLDASEPPKPKKSTSPSQHLTYKTPSKPESPSETLDEALQSDEARTPHPLGRPIGLHHPPSRGENSGHDARSLRDRYNDTLNKEKNLQRRKQLQNEMFRKPYFRDWTNLKYHKGKTFLANPRLFKKEYALWFPNLVGGTLERPGEDRDLVEVLRGRVSVVAVYSGEWALQQVESFLGKSENEGFVKVLKENEDVVQRVDINVEENAMRYWILRMVAGGLRKRRKREDWGKYFFMRKGISDDIREAVGILNGRVGYVYLLDRDCKIRWAGSGPSHPEEREGIVKSIWRLIREAKSESEDKTKVTPTHDEDSTKVSMAATA